MKTYYIIEHKENETIEHRDKPFNDIYSIESIVHTLNWWYAIKGEHVSFAIGEFGKGEILPPEH